jgi:hypothetical protein
VKKCPREIVQIQLKPDPSKLYQRNTQEKSKCDLVIALEMFVHFSASEIERTKI